MVEVSQHYAIESDGERNIIVLRKVVSRKDGSVSYVNDTYHNGIVSALQTILRKETKKYIEGQDGRKMLELVDDLKNFEASLVLQMISEVQTGVK